MKNKPLFGLKQQIKFLILLKKVSFTIILSLENSDKFFEV